MAGRNTSKKGGCKPPVQPGRLGTLVDATMPFAFVQLGSAAPAQGVDRLVLAVLIVFGSAKLLNELSERLGQPGVVGEIIAGFLIGPSVLNWIAPGEAITLLSELGLMFLLFRVGLEIRPPELLNVGGTSAAVALAGVVVPFFAAWGVCAIYHLPRVESFFVGAAMTATSVGITAEVLSARGLLGTVESRIILGAAVIDDVLALLALGIVSSIANGRVNIVELILSSLFALAFIAILVRWGSWTAGNLMGRLDGKLRVGEAPFVLTMILMFGLAALSAQAGVAAITGAFLAGTALSDTLPRRVVTQTDGIAEFLVPFFFAGVGLHLDLHALIEPSTVRLTLILLGAAIVSKIVACGLGAARHGFTVAWRVGLGMIPRGEFCIVAAQIGLALRVITAETYSSIVFIAVATTMFTPPLIRLAFRKPDLG